MRKTYTSNIPFTLYLNFSKIRVNQPRNRKRNAQPKGVKIPSERRSNNSQRTWGILKSICYFPILRVI